MQHRRLVRAAAGIAVVMLFAACSDNGADPTDTTPTPASVASTTPAPAKVTAAQLCASAVPSQAGTVASPDLLEISGIASSRSQDILWAANDSGDTARVFAVGPSGEAAATYTVNNAEATDWEDMAIGPGPQTGTDYLYLGDIGDNASLRPSITVYRAPEPLVSPTPSSLAVDAEVVTLVYPDGAHNAETLLVDPENGDLYIVTKDIAGGPSGIYLAPAPQSSAAPITLENVGQIDFAALIPAKVIPRDSAPLPSALGKVPTGGEIAPDGSIIAVRTYGTVWLWQRDEGQSVADALAAQPCEAPSEVEMQGEAIAFTADGRGYVTASEGANVAINTFTLP